MEIRYGPWEDQVKPSRDHIPGNTVVNETFDPMYEPSLLLSYLTWAVKTIHLFPPNLGGSARILDIVHPISAVRHISQLN